MTRPARLDPYVRRAQTLAVILRVSLSAENANVLDDHAKRLLMAPEGLLSEIVGKVLGDDLVDAVLDR